MRSRKKNALYLLPRLVGTCTISYQEKREGSKKNRVKTNTFVSILVPYSQPLHIAVSIATSLSSYVDFELSSNVQEKSQMIRSSGVVFFLAVGDVRSQKKIVRLFLGFRVFLGSSKERLVRATHASRQFGRT